MRIAVFDDDEDMRTMIGDFLQDEGYEVICMAKDPRELERIEECNVLILDVRTRTDRYAGINYVIQQRALKKIPQEATAVFISNFGRGNKQIGLLLAKAGQHIWLDKPIELAELKEALELTQGKGHNQ
jgi:DNA-binding response OmpR family regulator